MIRWLICFVHLLILLKYSSTWSIIILCISMIFLICSHFSRFFFIIILILSVGLRINIKSETTNQLSSLYNLAVYFDRTILRYFSLIWIWLFRLSAFLEFHLLYSTVNYFLNKLVSLPIFHFVIVSLTTIRQDHVALLRASSVLDGIATSYPLSIFDNMMLSCCVFHLDKSPSWRYLGGVKELRFWLIVVLILECIKEIMSSILGSLDIFHLFPDILNV